MKNERLEVGKEYLIKLMELSALEINIMAEILLVNKSVLVNIGVNEKFNSSISGDIIAIFDIYTFGHEVFDNGSLFNKWMFVKNLALGNLTPIDFLKTHTGRQEVRNIIGRISYGVYS